MDTPFLQAHFLHIAQESEAISLAVNRALDTYEQTRSTGVADVLELGVLLASVRQGRERALELTRRVPGPNRVPESVREQVVNVMQALFAFIASCDTREAIISKMARRLTSVSR